MNSTGANINKQRTKRNQTSNFSTLTNISGIEEYGAYCKPIHEVIIYTKHNSNQIAYSFTILQKFSHPGEITSIGYIIYDTTIKFATNNILAETTTSGTSPLQRSMNRVI